MKAIVVGILLTAALAQAAPSAKVEPPPGWTEDTIGADQLAGLKGKTGIVRSEVRQWTAPEGNAAFQIIEVEARFEGQNIRAMIDGMERGAENGAGSSQKLSSSRREVGNVVIVDHVVEIADRRVHFRRHYAADARGNIHNVTITCVGPIGTADVPACAPAFASFAWQIQPAALPAVRDLAERIGELIGYGAVAAVLVLLLLWAVRRKR